MLATTIGTPALAALLTTLPIRWALTAPVGEMRAAVRATADVAVRNGWHQHPDTDAAATVQRLIDLADQGHGSHRAPYRTQLLELLADTADTLAVRATTPATVDPAAAADALLLRLAAA